MIVKVQISVIPHSDKRVLVYNRERTVMTEFPLDDEFRALMHEEPAGLRPKAFFNATIENGELAIESEAPWQDW